MTYFNHAKTAEPIKMHPRNYVLDRGPGPPKGRGIFWVLSALLKSIESLCCGLTDRDTVCGLTRVRQRNHLLDGVKFERINSPSQGVTRRRCGLLSKFFDHLFYFLFQHVLSRCHECYVAHTATTANVVCVLSQVHFQL